MPVKPVQFLGDSLKRLRDFPSSARQDAGFQIDRVQRGYVPKPDIDIDIAKSRFAELMRGEP